MNSPVAVHENITAIADHSDKDSDVIMISAGSVVTTVAALATVTIIGVADLTSNKL